MQNAEQIEKRAENIRRRFTACMPVILNVFRFVSIEDWAALASVSAKWKVLLTIYVSNTISQHRARDHTSLRVVWFQRNTQKESETAHQPQRAITTLAPVYTAVFEYMKNLGFIEKRPVTPQNTSEFTVSQEGAVSIDPVAFDSFGTGNVTTIIKWLMDESIPQIRPRESTYYTRGAVKDEPSKWILSRWKMNSNTYFKHKIHKKTGVSSAAQRESKRMFISHELLAPILSLIVIDESPTAPYAADAIDDRYPQPIEDNKSAFKAGEWIFGKSSETSNYKAPLYISDPYGPFFVSLAVGYTVSCAENKTGLKEPRSINEVGLYNRDGEPVNVVTHVTSFTNKNLERMAFRGALFDSCIIVNSSVPVFCLKDCETREESVSREIGALEFLWSMYNVRALEFVGCRNLVFSEETMRLGGRRINPLKSTQILYEPRFLSTVSEMRISACPGALQSLVSSARLFKNIRLLNISGSSDITDTEFSAIVLSLPDLASLDISGCSSLTGSVFMPHFYDMLATTRTEERTHKLEVVNPLHETTRDHIPLARLRTLVMQDVPKLLRSYENYTESLIIPDTLVKLDISNNSVLPSVLLDTIKTRMPLLKVLLMRGCKKLTLEQLSDIGTYCKSIRKLDIGEICDDTDSIIDVLLRHHTMLTSLCLTNIPMKPRQAKKLVTGGGLSLTIHETLVGCEQPQENAELSDEEICDMPDDLFELYVVQKEMPRLRMHYDKRQKTIVGSGIISAIKKEALSNESELNSNIAVYTRERETVSLIIEKCKPKVTGEEQQAMDIGDMTLGEYKVMLKQLVLEECEGSFKSIQESEQIENSHISASGTYLPVDLCAIESETIRARLRKHHLDVEQLQRMKKSIEKKIATFKKQRVLALAKISPMFRLRSIDVSQRNVYDASSIIQWLSVLPRLKTSNITY